MSFAASFGADPVDLPLIDRIEAHACACWPANHTREFGDGWLLRATPGLARARSNNTLTPRRQLVDGELDAALAAGAAWSAGHGTRHGMQVTPLAVHAPVAGRLAALGWEPAEPVVVMGVETETVNMDDGLPLQVSRRATSDWATTWALCNDRDTADARAHMQTVFARLQCRGTFVSSGEDAAGILVDSNGLVGLFSLAVNPHRRRRGLGRRLVAGMLALADAPRAYLQVSSTNDAGLALYERVGFERLYTYQHWYAAEST